MIRLFSTFAWLRWRLSMNQYQSASRRDEWERFSRLMVAVTPMILLIVLLPVLLGLVLGTAFLGWGLATGEVTTRVVFLILRVTLIIPVAGILLTPLILAGRSNLPSVSRFLLLPIHQKRLHLMHLLSSLGDPWIFGAGLVLTVFTFGIAVGGRLGLALMMLLSACLLVSFLAAISSWVQTTLQLLMQERKRRDRFILGFFLLLIAGSYSLVGIDEGNLDQLPEMAIFMVNVPGELYVLTLDAVLSSRFGAAFWYLLATGLLSAAFYVLSSHAWERLLLETEDRGTTGKEKGWGRDWQASGVFGLGMSREAWGVARTQVKTMIRTVPGKMAVSQGLFGVLLLALIGGNLPSEEMKELGFLGKLLQDFFSWVPLMVATTFSALSLFQFFFNQFALSRAGLTREFLLPVSMRDLLWGKALGLGTLAVLSLGFALVPAALVGGLSGVKALAGSVGAILVLLGTILTMTPLAILFSTIFPRAVDLSHAFRQNQPPFLSSLLGMLSTLVLLSFHGTVMMTGTLLGGLLGGVALLTVCVGIEGVAVRFLLPSLGELVWSRRESILLALQRD